MQNNMYGHPKISTAKERQPPRAKNRLVIALQLYFVNDKVLSNSLHELL